MLATSSCEWSELPAWSEGCDSPSRCLHINTCSSYQKIWRVWVPTQPWTCCMQAGGQEPFLCSLLSLPGGIPALGPSLGRLPQPHPSAFNPSLSDRSPRPPRTGLAFQHDQLGQHTGGICFLAKATLAPKIRDRKSVV